MDETTAQGTFRLPRRLPKQPNQLLQTDAAHAVAEAPPPLKARVVEEVLPIYEQLPDISWPEFSPQEFTVPDDLAAPPEPVAQEEFPDPVWEFIAQDELPPALPEFRSEPERPFQVETQIPREEIAPPKQEVAPPVAVRPSRAIAPIPATAAPEPKPEAQNAPEPAPEATKPNRAPNGDPKPAFARPSGLSRSRPSRPSGTFPAARLSGAHAAAAPPKITPSGDEERYSRDAVSASTPVADTSPRLSGSTRASEELIHEASVSRTATPVRRRRTSASTVPSLIALSVLLVGYSFAVGPIESYLESQLIASSGPTGTLMTLVPWVSLIPVVLLLAGVLWIIAGLIGLRHVKPSTRRSRAGATVTGRKRKKDRRKAPLELFREEAAKEEIDGDTAYQCWRLLQPFGSDSHVLSIYDELASTLGMNAKQIQSVYQQLMPAAMHSDRFTIRTVLDLLRIVKQASLTKA